MANVMGRPTAALGAPGTPVEHYAMGALFYVAAPAIIGAVGGRLLAGSAKAGAAGAVTASVAMWGLSYMLAGV